jgi:glycosyltransferase involved in cell wall biosynthesis
MTYLVAQLGARMHYAIPRMLHEAGMLAHFYTDICAVKGWPKLLRAVPVTMRPSGLKRLLGRVPNNVPAEMISAFTKFGWEYQRRRAAAITSSGRTATSLWAGKRFCNLVIASGLHNADGVYTFNSAGLELLETARRQGLRTVMEQTIAPRAIEAKLLQAEFERFPGWEAPLAADSSLDEFIAREHAEWSCADLILCGSEFVRESISACGGPADRCVVLPYGVERRGAITQRKRHDGPLRVLTVGAIGLRKGTPYVLQAAKQLRGKAVFRMVGGITVLPPAEALLRKSVELTGPIPRTEMAEQFAWADVFVLPSLCEGSATVVYEALSAGLPVICTHNTGSVVRDGVDGYIIPIRDSSALVEAIEKFANTPDLLAHISDKSLQQARAYDLSAYKKGLVNALNNTGGM